MRSQLGTWELFSKLFGVVAGGGLLSLSIATSLQQSRSHPKSGTPAIHRALVRASLLFI